MTIQTVECAMCHRRVNKLDLLDHECSKAYAKCRKPFAPRVSKIIFVGMAPPVPKVVLKPRFKYIYGDPDSEFETRRTDYRWRCALKHALIHRPRLRTRYPHLAAYFDTNRSLIKRPFLDAVRDSDMIWVDCVELPVITKRVRKLIKDPEYITILSSHLARHDCQAVIFMTIAQRKLRDAYCEMISQRGLAPAVKTLPGTFWQMSASTAGNTIAEALAEVHVPPDGTEKT